MSKPRVTQNPVEVAGYQPPRRRVTQNPVELAGYQPPRRRVTQVVLEVAMTTIVATPRAWGQIIGP